MSGRLALVLTLLMTAILATGKPAQALEGFQIANLYSQQIQRNVCLDAENDSRSNPFTNHDPVQMWSCNLDSATNANQKWSFNQAGWTTVRNVMSGKCLDARADYPYNPSVNGDPIQLYDCNGADWQTWQVDSVGGGVNSEFILINYAASLVLDARNDTTHNPGQNGDKVQLWRHNGGVQQKWFL